jgi:hypothetical protein
VQGGDELPECDVAGWMALRVVDGLEPVEVEDGDGQIHVRSMCGSYGSGKVLVQGTTIRATRQWIDKRRGSKSGSRRVHCLGHQLVPHHEQALEGICRACSSQRSDIRGLNVHGSIEMRGAGDLGESDQAIGTSVQ